VSRVFSRFALGAQDKLFPSEIGIEGFGGPGVDAGVVVRVVVIVVLNELVKEVETVVVTSVIVVVTR
jgi:hypothetical protein